MIVKLWSLYLAALQTAPLLTKCLTSAVGFILGDSIAQLIAKERYNVLRTLRFATIGFCLHAPIADTWFLFLEHNVFPNAPTSMPAVFTKMALDQLLMAPLFLVVFFFATKTLEGLPHKLPEVLREQYVKTVLAGYLLWPLAHIINFKFIPADLRILYVNCVQVGWNVVLCRMSAGKPAGRVPEPKKYYERRLPAADIEIAGDRRRSLGQKTKRAPR
ncbi:g1050 [Coccomyxa viridis]|uniref:G1050 protein n=1 Tax=Coccomyxa viridis TaxID=1274662 RepID=A0ABP1FJ82_9CHLO